MAPVDSSKTKLTMSLDYRYLCVALVVIIAIMLVAWKPWNTTSATARTVDVTGDATITARPDEFVFYPTYEVTGGDKAAALADLSKKSDEIVAKLKSLGVPDSKIKSTTSGYDYPVMNTEDGTPTYTLQMTATVNNQQLAQKVQDYLVTTTPTGSVSPQANFSNNLRKQLEAKARDQATQDARAKAVQMGKNLGFKIGKVKSVQDGSGFGGIVPLGIRGTAMAQDAKNSQSLSVQPGENDLPYSVTVVYYIK